MLVVRKDGLFFTGKIRDLTKTLQDLARSGMTLHDVCSVRP